MSNNYVTDIMALIIRLEKRKLSQKIRAIFEAVEKGKINLMIPAMVLAEIGYLSERNKIDTNLHEVQDYCQKLPTVTIEPITAEVIYRSFEIDDIPELHDRIIAGTASLKNLELITNDPMIIKSKYVSTIW
ncbi:MAG: PIN domain-containing protein [Ignavibacteriales bacterium]|nr:PIN domain-containing protein [Ignavibacteriales bacterium]